jgi:hypothetical protein
MSLNCRVAERTMRSAVSPVASLMIITDFIWAPLYHGEPSRRPGPVGGAPVIDDARALGIRRRRVTRDVRRDHLAAAATRLADRA